MPRPLIWTANTRSLGSELESVCRAFLCHLISSGFLHTKSALPLFYHNSVIDGFDTLDDLEKVPVKDEIKHRPVRDIRVRSVTVHANPIAEFAEQ